VVCSACCAAAASGHVADNSPRVVRPPSTVGIVVVQVYLFDRDTPAGQYHLWASFTDRAFTALTRLERRLGPMYFTYAGPVPAISPDGRWIAYGTKGRRIVVAPIDIARQTAGAARTLLRVGRRDDIFSLAWSPDSRQLIFQGRRGGSQGVWRRPRDGHRAQLITATKVIGGSDTLAVSRRQVAFTANAPQYGDIAVAINAAPVAGGAPRLLAEPAEDASDDHPAWSPDGRQLVYVRDASGGASRLAILTPPSRRHRDLPVRGEHPTFSPDGRDLAYASRFPQDPHDVGLLDIASGRTWRIRTPQDLRELGDVWDLVWLKHW
jgi:Tol biopolymer transport system component